jgi:hypothetical protein
VTKLLKKCRIKVGRKTRDVMSHHTIKAIETLWTLLPGDVAVLALESIFAACSSTAFQGTQSTFLANTYLYSLSYIEPHKRKFTDEDRKPKRRRR